MQIFEMTCQGKISEVVAPAAPTAAVTQQSTAQQQRVAARNPGKVAQIQRQLQATLTVTKVEALKNLVTLNGTVNSVRTTGDQQIDAFLNALGITTQ